MEMRKRGDFLSDNLGYIIIGLIVLIIIIGAIVVMTKAGLVKIDYIKDIFRFKGGS